jgi:3-oxoacyl-[acyl-carrier protein] reductase
MSRNVLVIGGSKGTGAEAVRQFRALGHNVVFTYHKSEIEADALRQETGAMPVRCDVKFSNSVKIAADKAQNLLGHVDVLICDAAVCDTTPLAETEETRWEEIINTNLNGVFYCIRNVLPLMIQHRSGCIITTAPKLSSEGGSCMTACSAARAGVAGLTEALAAELLTSGIRARFIDCGEPDAAVSAMIQFASDEA